MTEQVNPTEVDLIVAIEGIDASGKATQAAMLVEALRRRFPGYVTAHDFPHYQTRTGQALKTLLRGDWFPEGRGHALSVEDLAGLRALVVQSLMTTNRLEFYELLKRFSGLRGEYLVLDRYYASGLVYGEADGIPIEYLIEIHRGLPPADLWLFIDIPSEESRRRRPERRDEYEKRAGFMEKVRTGYTSLFQSRRLPPLGGKWVIIDGLGTTDEVHQRVMAQVAPFLG